MTRIDPSSNLVAYIQEHAQRITVPDDKTLRPLGSNKKKSGQPADWLQLVVRSVAAVSPDDPQRRRKAFKIFLEAGLARELGIKDTKDCEFQRLMDQVNDVMLADPRIAAAIERAAELLIQATK
jgi:hypothetical protein